MKPTVNIYFYSIYVLKLKEFLEKKLIILF